MLDFIKSCLGLIFLAIAVAALCHFVVWPWIVHIFITYLIPIYSWIAGDSPTVMALIFFLIIWVIGWLLNDTMPSDWYEN